jgi:hypothetical protein
MEDQLQGGIVTPMHILERQEHWLRACKERERLRQRAKEPSLVRLGVDREARTHVGKKRAELREHRYELHRSRR